MLIISTIIYIFINKYIKNILKKFGKNVYKYGEMCYLMGKSGEKWLKI